MKTTLSVLITLCTFVSSPGVAQNSPPYFNQKDSIYVSGKISNFKPGTGDDFVSFTTFNLKGERKKEAFQVKQDGSFAVSLHQLYPGDIILNYKSAYVSVYTAPATTLILEIDADKISPETNDLDAFRAKGAFSAVNNLLFAFATEFGQQAFKYHAKMGDHAQTDLVFSKNRVTQLHEELDFLESFIKSRKITNRVFQNWQRNQLVYMAGNDILLFPFMGKINKTITEKQLIELIAEMPVNSTSALANSAYYDFLKMLATGEQIIINVNPAYEEVRQQNGNNPVSVILDQLDKISSGLPREIMYYDIFKSNTKVTSSVLQLLPRFKEVIREPYLKLILDNDLLNPENAFKSYNVIARLKASSVSDSLKKRLTDLFERENGASLFIDFWGDWCGPCLMEMPHYPKLIASFEGKPLKFMFFSALTSEKSMMAVKQKYRINAEFINLSKDEVAIVNNVFEFNSYPAHFVISPAGNVISNTARQAAEIERLLAK